METEPVPEVERLIQGYGVRQWQSEDHGTGRSHI